MLQLLPFELLNHLLSYLNNAHRAKLSLVCVHIYKFIIDDVIICGQPRHFMYTRLQLAYEAYVNERNASGDNGIYIGCNTIKKFMVDAPGVRNVRNVRNTRTITLKSYRRFLNPVKLIYK